MNINPRAVFLILGVASIAGGIGGVAVGFIAGGIVAVISSLVG